MMRLLPEAAYPLRLLVLPVDAHANEAVAHYAATMARSLAHARDLVYLAITPGGWCTPLAQDEPMNFVAWQAPASGDATNGVAGSGGRGGDRARATAADATRALVRAVQPECVLFVMAHAGHGTALLEGVAAAGVPAAVMVLNAHAPHAVGQVKPLFTRRQAYAHAWAVTSVQSQQVLARRLEAAPSALEVCPPGITLRPHLGKAELAALRARTREALNLPHDAFVVYASGRMDTESGCRDWAEAVAKVSEIAPSTAFVWTGHGPLHAEMREILRPACATGLVHLLREEDSPPDLDLAADLAVFPTRVPQPAAALGRAMAAGVPIIATAVDPVTEIVRPMREGLVCAKANPGSLADALHHALRHPDTLRAMANAAYLRIQDFSDERAVRSLRPLLERLSVLRGAVRSPGQRR